MKRQLEQLGRILVPALWLAGCAAQTQTGRIVVTSSDEVASRAPGGEPDYASEPAQPVVEPAGDPYGGVAPIDAQLARAIQASKSHYEGGRAKFRVGDIEAARAEFEQALDVFTSGDLRDRPEAQILADALTAQISAYEAAWVEASDRVSEEDLSSEPAQIDTVQDIDLPDEVTPATAPEAQQLPRLAHDVPLEVNNQVTYMLDIYKGRLKDEILPAFERSGRYLPMIRRIFTEEQVPLDLAWLALVESGFKPHAYSRAAAKGLWQFIGSTGRAYGLDADYWLDERADPEKATRAAARHLRDLYAHFGDWYLSLAAYNAGAARVDKAIKRVGSRNYWDLAASRHLHRETKNYVPAFLATLLIASDPQAHGYDYTPQPAWEFETVQIDGPADLEVVASAAGVPLQALRELNPELRRPLTPGNQQSYTLRVPPGRGDTLRTAWASLPAAERLRYVTHSVARGETLSRIARRYGVSLDSVMAANDLRSKHRIPVGVTLTIPLTPEFAARAMSDAAEPERSRKEARAESARSRFHTVRRGDTLTKIASRYGVSVSELREWNRLGSSSRIVVGRRLRVSQGSSAMRSRAGSATRVVTHRVRRGETLTAIASRYGVSVPELARWNGQTARDPIGVGQRLQVHVSKR